MFRLLSILVMSVIPWAACISGEVVKKSNSGICHDQSSPYYSRTKHFHPYNDLQSCLDSGGRLPKGYSGYQQGSVSSSASEGHQQSTKYDRSQFGGWSDEDHDCLNTRHELLIKLSTGTIQTGSNACTVSRGRWNDPYTGKIFYEAQQMDIDHLVPLKWAWDRGASSWSDGKRKAFANDEANLFAVEARVNRQKGAMGPLEWLPPNKEFHCQYILRFTRITKKYGLVLSAKEDKSIRSLREGACGSK